MEQEMSIPEKDQVSVLNTEKNEQNEAVEPDESVMDEKKEPEIEKEVSEITTPSEDTQPEDITPEITPKDKKKTEVSSPDSVPQLQAESDEEEENFENATREELVAALSEIVNEQDVTLIKKKISAIKVAFLRENKLVREAKRDQFIADGGVGDDYIHVPDEVEEKFKVLFDVYRQNKARFNKSQEELKLKNLELKKQILEELKELNNSEETLKKTYDDFKALQERWKDIGIVPQSEINNLWQSYHFLVEMFFDKVKINKELRDLDLKKNLELKVELCEKTEELLLEPSITKSFKELQNYHDQWKKIGPVPMDVKEDIWERFKQATDKINERRREFYTNLQEEQKKNLELKKTLCEQAEELFETELTTLKEWQEQTEKVNKLLEEWKTIGPAPKRHNDEIWRKFKHLLNNFFENKKDFYAKLKEQQLNNYNKKLDLCLQAEGLKGDEDWKKTTVDLINLQKEWKTIGPVPKKYSDKVWKRFRAACDEFFNNKAKYYSDIRGHEDENLAQKKALIQKVKDYKFGDDKKQNLGVLKEFQKEWMKIGHVPIKEKEKLQALFRKAINAHLENLKIDQVEFNAINYKSKIENMSDSPSSRNMIYKERNFLTTKINKMKEDILLWENNVGFLANSKNANLLKAEFEKKIEDAKSELSLMEAKLRVINNAEIG